MPKIWFQFAFNPFLCAHSIPVLIPLVYIINTREKNIFLYILEMRTVPLDIRGMYISAYLPILIEKEIRLASASSELEKL